MRIVDRILGALIGLLLLVGGLVAAVEIVLAGLGRTPWLVPHDRWAATARSTPWADGDVRLALVGVVLIGLALVVSEGARRRPEALPLMASGAGVVAELDRRHLERWLVERVERVQGVVVAKARVTGRVAAVEATCVGPESDSVTSRVREAAGRHLEALELDRTPRLRVKIRPVQAPR